MDRALRARCYLGRVPHLFKHRPRSGRSTLSPQSIITDQPFDDKQRWIELRVPKTETLVVLFTTDNDKDCVGTFMNMSYTCDDLQKTYEHAGIG